MIYEHPNTLQQAIEDCAIFLDRPFWFDNSRLERQVEAWQRLVNQYADNRVGMLTSEDFQRAVTIGLATHDAREVLPSRIVQDAVGYAVARTAAAQQVIWNADFPQSVLYEARNRLSGNVATADATPPDELPPADHKFATARARFIKDADEIISDLKTSGLDHAEVDRVVTIITARRAEVLDKLATHALNP